MEPGGGSDAISTSGTAAARGKVGRTATGGAPVSEESGDGLTGSPRPGQPDERPRAGRCGGGG